MNRDLINWLKSLKGIKIEIEINISNEKLIDFWFRIVPALALILFVTAMFLAITEIVRHLNQ